MATINLIILIMRDREKEQSNVIAVSPEGGDCPPDHQTYLSPLFMSTFLLSSSSSLLSSSYVIIIMINEASSSRHCHPRDYHRDHQVPQASERSTCCLNHWQIHHSAEVYCCLLLSYILFTMVMITTNTIHKIRSSSSSSSSSSSASNFSYRRSFPAARGGETSSSSSHRTSRLVLASDLDNGFIRKAADGG